MIISLGVRELQADEVEDLWSMRSHEVLDELAEFHLAVRLARHVDHVDDFVATCVGDKRSSAPIATRFWSLTAQMMNIYNFLIAAV